MLTIFKLKRRIFTLQLDSIYIVISGIYIDLILRIAIVIL